MAGAGATAAAADVDAVATAAAEYIGPLRVDTMLNLGFWETARHPLRTWLSHIYKGYTKVYDTIYKTYTEAICKYSLTPSLNLNYALKYKVC